MYVILVSLPEPSMDLVSHTLHSVTLGDLEKPNGFLPHNNAERCAEPSDMSVLGLAHRVLSWYQFVLLQLVSDHYKSAAAMSQELEVTM